MNSLIVIPAYNVGQKIRPVLDSLKKGKYDIIVIDDGSIDETSRIVEESGVSLIRHETNMGLSQAYNTGFEYARNNGFKRVVTLDADGQHDPAYVDEFVKKLSVNDCVIGNRFYDIDNIPSCKIASNLIASLIVYSVTGVKIRDVSCGFRGFNLEYFTSGRIFDRFEIIYEQLYQVLSSELKVDTVDIPVIYPCSELYCTKISEMVGLLNASIRHCDNKEFLPVLHRILEGVAKKVDFHFEIEGYKFYCFYIPNLDSYICQTDLKKAKTFYENE